MLPREKFQLRGIDALSDSDLISLLIGSGVKGRDFSKISRSVIRILREESVVGSDRALELLNRVEGVGDVVGMRILAGIELGRRLYGVGVGEVQRVMDSEAAYELLKDMGRLKNERVDAIYLNSRFELLRRDTIVMGSLNCTRLVPRDVLIPALELNSSSFLIAHNHPSGDVTPSEGDIQFTRRLSEASLVLGIEFLDHIVIGKGNWKCVEI